VLGHFFLQPRSKAFENFLHREKKIQSNCTGMALNQKIFRIIEFPDFFLFDYCLRSVKLATPNLIKIEQIAFELEVFKLSPSSEK